MAGPVDSPIPNWREHAYWAKIAKGGEDDCWRWTGSRDSSGYGNFWVRPKLWRATHLALILAGHPKPEAPNNHALHSCDNPACVNPKHLRWGTHKQNMEDRNERKPGYKREPRQRWSKLTAEQVRYVLDSPKLGYLLAEELGVHKATISDIRCGKTWGRLRR